MMIQRRPGDPRLTPVRLRRDLIQEGWTDKALARLVREKRLAKPRRGAYVDAAVWRELDPAGRHELTVRAVVQAADSDVVVSHTSSIPFYDAPTYGVDFDWVHTTRRDQHPSRREAGVAPHRGLVLPGDVVRIGDLEIMHPTRAGLECTTVLDTEASLVLLNDLTHRGLTSVEQMRERYERSMDHWPDTLATDLVLRLVEPRCESVGETRSLHLCFRHGLPLPEPQVEIKDSRGRVFARVDFAWPELGVFLEFDGKEKYLKHRRPGESFEDFMLREKRREREICRITGWRCLRITWADLERPEATARLIRDFLFGAHSAA